MQRNKMFQKSVDRRSGESRSQPKQGSKCRYCGGAHEQDKHKCPVFDKSCRKCGKASHFQSVCMQKQGVNLMNAESSDDEYAFYVETVDAIRTCGKKALFCTPFLLG